MSLRTAPVALALLLCSATILEAGEPGAKWGPWLDAGAFHNNRDQTRGESTLWAPLLQSPTSLLFGEVTGNLFEESQHEGNFDLGFRQMYAAGWNLGLWGGYDIRTTALGSTFHQVSGGLEALSENWEFRLNGYVPLNDSNDVGSYSFSTGGASTVLLSGSTIMLQTGVNSVTSTQVEYAMGGVDAEIGMRLPVEAINLDPAKLDLRVYGGGFYFDNNDADKAIAGPKVRAELRFNDVIAAAPGSRLTLETEYTSDDVRGDRIEVGGRFRIPLDGGQSFAKLNVQEQLMTERIRRDTDVVSSAKSVTTTVNTLSTEAVEDAATNVALNNVAYVDGATAGGISSVAAAQGANTLIVAQGGNGNITSNVLLQTQQTLVGGGGTITLKGATTGTLVQFTAPGSQATIDGQAGNYAVRLVDDTHAAGLNINVATATGGFVVGAQAFNVNTNNVVIEGNTIAANVQDAVVMSAGLVGTTSSNVVVAGNTITNAGNGIAAFFTTGSQITGNTVNGAGANGISVSLGVSDLKIHDNMVTTSGNTVGLLLSGNNDTLLDIVGNTINSRAPIFVPGSAVSGNVSNNSLDAQGFDGVTFQGNLSTLTGTGNTFSNGTLCNSNGLNGGSNIQFIGGATCP
jgi:parallel beta-helix repeat protein